MHGPSIRGSHASIYIYDIEEFGTEMNEQFFQLPLNCVNSTELATHQTKDVHAPKTLKTKNELCTQLNQTNLSNLPSNFSWKDHPLIVPYPHDQAVCGSCWAQGTMGSISAQFSLKANKSIIVSVQQIVDCTWGNLNFACDGGEHSDAFDQLIKSEMLLALEDEYPYIGIGGECGSNFKHTVGKVIGCAQVPPNDDELLKSALYTHGPLSISIIADQSGFSTLTDGVYNNPECRTTLHGRDHAVLLTGWATLPDGTQAWEIENSWSDVWGNN